MCSESARECTGHRGVDLSRAHATVKYARYSCVLTRTEEPTLLREPPRRPSQRAARISLALVLGDGAFSPNTACQQSKHRRKNRRRHLRHLSLPCRPHCRPSEPGCAFAGLCAARQSRGDRRPQLRPAASDCTRRGRDGGHAACARRPPTATSGARRRSVCSALPARIGWNRPVADVHGPELHPPSPERTLGRQRQV